MTLKTIAGQDYEDVCVFQSDNGNIYVAMRDKDTPEPIELVGNSDMFTYGCVEEDSKCALFKRIMGFYEVHGLALWDVKDMWSVIDQAKGVTIGAIYAESGKDAVELYLNKGADASLNNIINNVRGKF